MRSISGLRKGSFSLREKARMILRHAQDERWVCALFVHTPTLTQKERGCSADWPIDPAFSRNMKPPALTGRMFTCSESENYFVMNISIKILASWLILGPVFALTLSMASWYVFDLISPGKLHGIDVMISMYPLGLLMSLLTPWGWLMYGGLLLMNSEKLKWGIWCTVIGAVLLGGFWPLWSTDLA